MSTFSLNKLREINQYRRNSGVVLIIGLLILVVLTLLGLASSQSTWLEEKMVGNMSDRNVAFQAASSALRDAERDIQGVGPAGVRRDPAITGCTGFFYNCDQFDATQATGNSDDGLCYRGWGRLYYQPPQEPCAYAAQQCTWPAFTPDEPPPAVCPTAQCPKITIDMTAAPSVVYGRYTGVYAIPNVSAQPRYIIECQEEKSTKGLPSRYIYRITVRAQGKKANTVVWLQEVYQLN